MTERQGDKETRGQGDIETRRQGSAGMTRLASLHRLEIIVGADLCVCPGFRRPAAPGQTHWNAPALRRAILDLLSPISRISPMSWRENDRVGSIKQLLIHCAP